VNDADVTTLSTERLRALAEQAPGALADADGAILHATPLAAPLLGRTLFDQVDPADHDDAVRLFRRIIDRAPVSTTGRHRFRTGDGESRWIEWGGTSHLDDPDVRAVALRFRDVTRLADADRRLLECEQTYRSIAERNPDPVFSVDPTGRFLEVNPAAEQVSGYSADELRSMTFDQLCAPERRSATIENFRRSLEGHPENIETTLVRKDGSRVDLLITGGPVVADGRVVAVYCSAKDISRRRRAEDALRRNEQRYRSLVLASAQVVWSTTADGQVVEDLPTWRAFTGQTADEARGRGWVEAIHPDDREQVRRDWERSLVERRAYEGEFRIRSADGGYRLVHSRGVPVVDDNGAVREWVGTIADVTERRSAEALLREHQQRLQAVVSHTPVVLFSLDANGVFTLSEGRGLAALGLKPGQVVGRSVFDQYAGNDAVLDNVRASLGGETRHWMARVDGVIFDTSTGPLTDDAGRVTGMIGVATDVTERFRAYESLKENEEQLRATFSQAAVGIAQVATDGRWMRVNQRLCDILGFAERELLGRPFTELTHPDDAPGDVERVRSMMAGERQTYTVEKRYVRKDGTPVWVNVTASLVRSAAGEPRYFISVVEDISQRKRAEADRDRLLVREQAARAQAEAANRAKDQLLAVVSHELRTPLTPVLAAVGLLERTPELPEEVKEYVGMIRRNVELESRLIDDLLDLTRISSGKLQLHVEPTDVHKLIGNAAAIYQRDAAAKRLALMLDLAAPWHELRADPARLQQVFWNLIGNAVKFTPAGGSVSVRTSAAGAGNNGGDGTGGRRIRVEVIDTGIGIEPSVMARLFTAFEQGETVLTRRFGGLGLGLTICRAIVELHGGTIHAHSIGRGSGATMTVELPLAGAAAAAAAAPSGREAGGAGSHGESATRPLHVLLVEDNRDTIRVMGRVLRSLGHRVHAAGSVNEALDAARGGSFDLLVSDIGLPDGSGWELLRRLREGEDPAARPLPAIALSGFGTTDDLRQSREAGFADHLVKPINVRRLQDAIAQAVH
jgi:PAS domain S-box-containing protein